MNKKEPLYIRAQQGLQGDIQLMDKETVEWLFKTANPKKTLITGIYPNYEPVDSKVFLEYVPKLEWFANKEITTSIHGIRHIFREVLLSGMLYQLFKPDFKLDDLLLCALVHDLRRHNDRADEGHGKRAAAWLVDNKAYFRNIYDYEQVLDAISNHDSQEQDDSSNKLLKFLKAADSLDRYRQPKEKWWPKKEYFLIPIDDSILEFVKYFTYITEAECLDLSPKDYINQILNSAIELKLAK